MIVSEPPWESTAHLFAGKARAGTASAAAAAGGVEGKAQAASGASPTPPDWAPYAPLQQQVCTTRQRQRLPPPGTLLRPAIWRRQLQAGASRYLLPLLGRDEGGSVVLSGEQWTPSFPAAGRWGPAASQWLALPCSNRRKVGLPVFVAPTSQVLPSKACEPTVKQCMLSACC
jgi:hypothetical protein